MLGSRHETIIGRPLVPGASVTAAIEVGRTSLPPQCEKHLVRFWGKDYRARCQEAVYTAS